MTTLGSVVIELAVNLARFKSDMGQAAAVSNTRLREIQRQTANTVKGMEKMGNTVRGVFGALGLSIGVGSIVMALKTAAAEAISFGDEVQKASMRTGIGAAKFAELAEAAKLVDVEMKTLSMGLRNMQIQISDAANDSKGTGAAAKAFRALGIEVSGAFRAMSADQQLIVIADQLSRMKGEADRTAVGTDLFKKAWLELAPFMLQGAAGIKAATDEVNKLGGALTDEDLAKLAEADDAIKRMTASWKGFARTLTADVAPALSSVFDYLANMISGTETAELKNQIALLKALETSRSSFMSNKSGENKRYTYAFNVPGFERGMVEMERVVKRRQELERQLRDMSPARLRAVSRTPASTLPEPPGPEDTGVAGMAARVAARMKARMAAAKKDTADVLKAMRDNYAAVALEGLKAIESMQSPAEKITQTFEEQRTALQALAETYPGMRAQAEEAMARAAAVADEELEALKRSEPELQRHNALLAEGQAMYEASRTAAEEYTAALQHVSEMFAEGAFGEGQAATDKVVSVVKALSDEYQSAFNSMTVFAEQAGRNMQDSFAQFLFDPFKAGLGGMLASFVDTIRAMVAEAAAAEILRTFFSWAAGATTGGWSSFFGSMGAGVAGKAAGGPVRAGGMYLVGERGPELLRMGSVGGTVIPNAAGAGGGNVSVSYSIDARGADADRIMMMLPPLLRQTEQRTLAQVRDLIARGRLV